MNETEIHRIAQAINALRPDWPIGSLATFITSKLANRARRDVAVALAWIACESESKTPARVLEAGPWWHVGNENRAPRPVKAENACHDCGRDRNDCGHRPGERTAPTDTFKQARDQLRRTDA